MVHIFNDLHLKSSTFEKANIGHGQHLKWQGLEITHILKWRAFKIMLLLVVITNVQH